MKKIAVGLLLGLAALAAAAQDAGFYLGASLTGSSSGACDGIQLGVSCEDGVNTVRIFAGYQVNPNLAVEAGLVPTLAQANAHAINSFVAASFASELRSRAVDFLLVPSLPLGASAFVYGKVGFYVASTEQENTTTIGSATCCVRVSTVGQNPEETNVGLAYGAGLGWSFTRQLAVRADWQRYNGVGGGKVKEIDVDTLNVGVLYRF